MCPKFAAGVTKGTWQKLGNPPVERLAARRTMSPTYPESAANLLGGAAKAADHFEWKRKK